jgi:hypothetical protein
MNWMRRLIRSGRGAKAAGLLLLCATAAAQLDEYQAKAVFLYKVASFVEWPAGAFKGEGESLAVCVLGPTPFEQRLDTTVRNKTVDGRAFTVRQATDAKQIAGCHLLFVSAPGLKRFRALRGGLKALTGVLVVGESEGFATEGGVINFKLVDGRIRIEINVEEARREGLVINSRLLGMADVVGK